MFNLFNKELDFKIKNKIYQWLFLFIAKLVNRIDKKLEVKKVG